MAGSRQGYVTDDYRTWSETSVDVAGQRLVLASKPGVFSHESMDPSSVLLAKHVQAAPGDVVVQMNCGNGLFGAALSAAGRASRVLLADRNVLAVEAIRRTLAANGAKLPEVFLGQGRHALPPCVAAHIVAIRIPHEKLALLELLHDAFSLLAAGGQCFIAGATNEGAKSAARTMEEVFGNAATIATESGHRVVRAVKNANGTAIAQSAGNPFLDHDAFEERQAVIRGGTYTFSSRPGVFSWDHLDEATVILADSMDVRADDRVLDLGCGYGVLGVVAGGMATVHPVTMLDVDSEAVRCATRSAHAAGLANARVSPSDIAAAVIEERFDLVITNPPFHVGKATDLSVPIQFIKDAWTVLAPGGRLNLVANRTLPYEGAIKYLFRNITTVHDGPRFKVLAAVKA
jgi:16S rRNA (guanine1207-N2)-methyltransferase